MNELAKALSKAQAEMEAAKKDANNPFFKSKYADLSSVVAAIKEPLSKNGLAYVQVVETKEDKTYVRTILMHESGQFIEGSMLAKPTKDDMQGLGSAITYARRYALQAIVGLSAEDDDGNAASVPTKVVKITDAQASAILDILDNLPDSSNKKIKFLKYMGYESVSDILAKDYDKAISALNAAKEKKQ